jgi:hypothetical protein
VPDVATGVLVVALPSRWLPAAVRLLRKNRLFVDENRGRRHVEKVALHPALLGRPALSRGTSPSPSTTGRPPAR